MGKAYKQWKKKVNPEGSNKMIYAVAAGLLLILLAFIIYTVMSEKNMDKKELMSGALEYLKHNHSFKELKIVPEENRVTFIYDDFTEKDRESDLILAAHYAGIKLSNRITDQEFTVSLCRGKESDLRYNGVFRDGKAIREKRMN